MLFKKRSLMHEAIIEWESDNRRIIQQKS